MNVVSCGSVGYVCVRYPTNVVYCIVKKRLFCTFGRSGVLLWMDGWIDV